MFTRKHMILIAEILADEPNYDLGVVNETKFAMVSRFADMLGESNPRFDRSKFYRACGIERH
jgi:hypothetical protein